MDIRLYPCIVRLKHVDGESQEVYVTAENKRSYYGFGEDGDFHEFSKTWFRYGGTVVNPLYHEVESVSWRR